MSARLFHKTGDKRMTVTSLDTAPPISSTGALYTKIAWRIIPFLMLIFFFANLDRANVGFAALQMRQELGFSNTAYGLGAGIFFLGYFLFEIPSNIMLQRVGARLWFARIVFTWGLATISMAFVKDTTWFYILRFIVGASEAGAAPGVMLYLSQWVPDSQRGRLNALYWISAPLAFVISGPLSGGIMTQMHSVAGHSGWQWLFLVEGALTILAAPLIYFALPDRIRDAKWLTEAEKQIAEAGAQSVQKTAKVHTYKDALKRPETIFACLAYFFLLIGYYGIAFWLPQLIKLAGTTNTMTVGWISTLPWLASIVAVYFIGPFSDRNGRRGMVRTTAVFLTAFGFAFSAYFNTNLPLSILGLMLAAAGILCGSTVFWANMARIYVGGAAAVGFATVNSIGNLGGFVSPYTLGFIMDKTGSPVLGMYAISACVVVSGILMYFCFRKSDA
jgi:MFS family permease